MAPWARRNAKEAKTTVTIRIAIGTTLPLCEVKTSPCGDIEGRNYNKNYLKKDKKMQKIRPYRDILSLFSPVYNL
jgi:hypothetical protein